MSVATTTHIAPENVHDTLNQSILADGMDMVMDLEKSQGSKVYDKLHNREMLDFFTCFATIPLGYNHPKMLNDEAFKEDLMEAALVNPSNSDIYTTQYADFVAAFRRVCMRDYSDARFFHQFRRTGGRERHESRDGLESAEEFPKGLSP